MPTGYTDILGREDVSFNRFAQRCARAFGACVMLRDEPLTDELPDEMPDSTDYHRKNIHKDEMRMSRLRHATPNQLRSQMLRELQSTAKYAGEGRERAMLLQKRYSKMLVQIGAWEAPSDDHKAFKKFMVDQIVQSAEHDCRTEYYDKRDDEVMAALRGQTIEQWRDEKIEDLQRSVAYHRKELKAEKERKAGRETWVRQLKESLEAQADNKELQELIATL